MRRFLLILLLLILPFQATLAAVDLCCSVDRGVRHQPCASEPAARPVAGQVASHDAGAVDIHCAWCFLASVGLMPAPFLSPPSARPDRQAVADAAPPLRAGAYPSRPERPQWRAAA